MQSLRFHASKDLRLEDLPNPDDTPPPGEVRLRNTYCGICGTDLHEYTDGPIFIPTEPHPFTSASGPQTLGHEYGGVVEAAGEGVSRVKPGDRVSVQPLVMPRQGDYYADRGLFHLSNELALKVSLERAVTDGFDARLRPSGEHRKTLIDLDSAS